MGIFDRLATIAETEAGKAFDTAHQHFHERLNTHGHFGRALLESLAETARNHPSFMGVAVGVVVEQLLVHEKHHHETELGAEAARDEGEPPSRPALAPPHAPHHELRLWSVKPGRLAAEVFGALLLLKFGVGVARAFSRKRPALAPAARIRLFSATIATYLTAKALRAHDVSAWRNAGIMLFGTDALKPLLGPDFSRPPPVVRAARPESEAPRPPAPAPMQAPAVVLQ